MADLGDINAKPTDRSFNTIQKYFVSVISKVNILNCQKAGVNCTEICGCSDTRNKFATREYVQVDGTDTDGEDDD